MLIKASFSILRINSVAPSVVGIAVTTLCQTKAPFSPVAQ